MDMNLFTRTAEGIAQSERAEELGRAWELVTEGIRARGSDAARTFDSGALVTLESDEGNSYSVPAIELLAELFEETAWR